MEFDIETTPILPIDLRSAFVAPTHVGAVAGVCPQAGFRRSDALTLIGHGAGSRAADAARTTTGFRSWSPLIT